MSDPQYVDDERPAVITEDLDPEAPADAPEELSDPPGGGIDAQREEPESTTDELLADENAATSLDQPSEDVE